MTTLLRRAAAFEPELVELRRDLHRHPELAFAETRTARVAAERVAALGFRTTTGVGRTGVVAELGECEPVVALRADMDALPIQEANDVAYRSTVPGVMHACGHDAHVAMLVGAARLLSETPRPRGTIRLLFQPSEEASDDDGKSGALRMIEDGAMRGVSAVFGAHIGAHLPAGRILASPGPIMAGSDRFTLTIEGRAAHAARPDEGVDAIVIAAHVILALQSALARALAPSDQGVLHIGTVHGGVAENVLAEHVELLGTLRYFEERVRKRLHDELHAAARIGDALHGRSRVDLVPGYPPVVNDAAMTELVRNAARGALGDDAEIGAFEPWMGAEDFAFLAREAPGCFFWIGAALDPPREHHHPRFDIDERVLARGAAVLAACAMHALEETA